MRKRYVEPSPPPMPAELYPDHDAWGSPAEEEKRRLRDLWLEANNATRWWYFEEAPRLLEERRRAKGLPPRIPSRRRAPLPAEVLDELRRLEAEAGPADEEGGS